MFHFDIDSAEWTRICESHHPADVMQAINKMKSTRDTEPARIHDSLVYWLNRLDKERKALATWPPTDTKQIKN